MYSPFQVLTFAPFHSLGLGINIQLTMKDKIAATGWAISPRAVSSAVSDDVSAGLFLTDVFGLSAGIMGTLFWFPVLDAVTDPLMGPAGGLHSYPPGQFRPFLQWGAIPFGIVCNAGTFYTSPDFSAQGKIIYARRDLVFFLTASGLHLR